MLVGIVYLITEEYRSVFVFIIDDALYFSIIKRTIGIARLLAFNISTFAHTYIIKPTLKYRQVYSVSIQ